MHACGVKLHTKPINFLGSRPGSQGPRVEIKKKKKGMPLEASHREHRKEVWTGVVTRMVD